MGETDPGPGFWKSAVNPEDVFSRPSSPQFPVYHDGAVYFVETRAAEGGRNVLVRWRRGGSRTITPDGYSVRTRVHEYGGRAFAIHGELVVFANDKDQRLYCQRLDDDTALPLTPEVNADGSRSRYAEPVVCARMGCMIMICERIHDDGQNSNAIGVLPLPGAAAMEVIEPEIIEGGHDFYASPLVFDGDGQLAWIQWDHPAMPWDDNKVVTAKLNRFASGWALSGKSVVAPGRGYAACELSSPADGRLVFAADFVGGEDGGNFWNWCEVQGNDIRALTDELREHGGPMWSAGSRRSAVVGPDTMISAAAVAGEDRLYRVDLSTGIQREVSDEYLSVHAICSAPGGAWLVAATARGEPDLLDYNDSTGKLRLARQGQRLLPDEEVSRPRHLEVPTSDGQICYAFYYPPVNTRYRLGDMKPPMLVMVHGGPTSRTDPGFAAAKQFWTTRGFAVLDVNHRGSTGYGRKFREALYGHWGIRDCDDVADAVRHAAAAGLCDAGLIFIRGSSAGGYVVLCALTRHAGLFAAGACYYGIGNLVTLARSTHKFESRYTDRLIGEPFAEQTARKAGSLYQERSPINRIASLKSPMIIFQGDEDRVVPVTVAHELVQALKENQVRHAYVEYAGEGHGFRRAENRINAICRELEFYRSVMEHRPDGPAHP